MEIFEYKTINFETGQPISVFSSSMENDGRQLVSLISSPHLGSRRYALGGVFNNILAVLKREQRESVNK
ncbi:DUF4177 domain-containing protein [Clostridium botulinum]|uniref:Uncharacterized protein n=1 Tax=Clostridium botulinum (strain Okra / Type B1) TaxID=498213 RepID=B1IJC5_CLOBK|nr:hypothetical protein [Clostridium botulinum]ACA44192.1 hypothetical protein CLD_3325 [Clostridium botulinum B1 str. Okra]MBD5563925.1 DUF4177 domain-containing protein [Clostridium botulinum]MBD5565747.1 DUF4177 domain-containing protein [Clostridium botulinum]MBD5569736.1 DUF4177 domain-containing protein [Clostridium botulinum]MBD5573468.1 DUF4177 domain-containing protein [Clostridium botulinum]